MAAVYYTKSGKQYTVEQCELHDVDTHYDVVKELVDDVDEEEYKKYMSIAVEQGTAYKVSSDKLLGFLYVRKEVNRWHGASIRIDQDIVAATVLLKTVFENVNAPKIQFRPHKDVLYLKSLATGKSIRLWHFKNDWLTVMIDEARQKFAKIYEALGIHQ
jgi:hypothetical protein